MLLPASDIISVLASSAPSTAGAVDAALAASGTAVPQPGQISSTQLFTQLLQGTLLTGISAGALPGSESADGGAVLTSSGDATGDEQGGDSGGQQQAGILAWLFPVAALAAPPVEQTPVTPQVEEGVILAPTIQAALPEVPQLGDVATVPAPTAPVPVVPSVPVAAEAPAQVDAALPEVASVPAVEAGSAQGGPVKPRDLLTELLARIKNVPAESSPEKALQQIQEMISSSSDVDVEELLQKILASAAPQQPKSAAQVAEKIAVETPAPVQALAALPAVKTAVQEESPARTGATAPVMVQTQDGETPAPVPAVQPVSRELAGVVEKPEVEARDKPAVVRESHANKPAAPEKPASSTADTLLRQLQQVLNVQPQAAAIPADLPGDQNGAASFSASNGPDLSAIAGALADRLSQLDGARTMSEGLRSAVHRAHDVVDQVSVKITQAAREGANLIQIRLEPQDLGRVDVRLDVAADGKASISVIASSRESLEALQAGSRHLEKALTDAGLKADSGSLSFSYRGDPQGNQQFANQLPQLGQYRSPAEEEAAEIVHEVTLSYRPEHNRELDIKV